MINYNETENLIDLQSVSKYFETFRCFTKFSFHQNEKMCDYYL